MWAVGITAVTAFVATNVDELPVLALFFSDTGGNFRPRDIVAGQYLGFLAVVAMSLPGFAGGFAVSKPWSGLAGLATIGIGVYRLIVGCRDRPSGGAAQIKDAASHPSVFRSLFNPRTYAVAATALSCGSDNVAAYAPLFANSNAKELAVIVGIFLCLLAVWCYIAYRLTRHPTATQVLKRYGRVLVPLMLIGLGAYILIANGTVGLLGL